jgi:hypothetical protein
MLKHTVSHIVTFGYNLTLFSCMVQLTQLGSLYLATAAAATNFNSWQPLPQRAKQVATAANTTAGNSFYCKSYSVLCH